MANLVSSRERPLGLLDLPPQLQHSPHVLPQYLALLLLIQLDEVVHIPLVEVFTSMINVSCKNKKLDEIIINISLWFFLNNPNMASWDHYINIKNNTSLKLTVGFDDIEDTGVDGEEGDIKGSATKIEHKDVLPAFLLVHTISDGGSRLVDDPHHVQASDGSGVLGGLPLSIVSVGRHGDDCVGDLLAKGRLGCLLHLGQNHSRDFLSCKGLLALAGLHLDVLLNKLAGSSCSYFQVAITLPGMQVVVCLGSPRKSPALW